MANALSLFTQRYHGPEVVGIRGLSVLAGSVLLVSSVASLFFANMPAALAHGILGALFVAGGATGYLGMPVLAIILAVGVGMAAPAGHPFSMLPSVIIL